VSLVTTQYPIVDLSDIARSWQNIGSSKVVCPHASLNTYVLTPIHKDFAAFLVQEGIIMFFFDDAADGYTLADSFNEE
jgi:hypothetical protein